jgi:hypothetical protein
MGQPLGATTTQDKTNVLAKNPTWQGKQYQ